MSLKLSCVREVDELNQEPSIKKALILLNKYHEDWKNIGPVPKEFSEELWNRFKQASDAVYSSKKGQLAEIDSKRQENYQQKLVICEKVEALVNSEINKAKDWIEKTQALQALFEEWRKIGPVPKEHNQPIWQRFRELNNQFYKNKNAFFKALNKEKAQNLKQKEQLCEKAEALKDSEDFMQTANQLKHFQEEWKKIGPVPEKASDKVWKRFRAACDEFFNRKSEAMKGKLEEEEQNLALKTAVCEKAEQLLQQENLENPFEELRTIQGEWNKVGFVPIKHKNAVTKRYQLAVDELYKKYKIGRDEMNQAKMKEHYRVITNMPRCRRQTAYGRT